MKRPIYLFDLDGTLTDPKEGITKAIRYSLDSFGIPVADLDELIPFIGPPLRESFVERYGFSEADSVKAVAKYREYFADQGIFENKVYDGVEGLLREQQQEGATLAVATSKPTVYAERILRHFKLDAYFSIVAGSELDGTRTNKALVIRYALELLGVTDAQSALMVGDRKHDVLGAREAGMDSIGVLYGYGSENELRNAGATRLAASVAELRGLLYSNL